MKVGVELAHQKALRILRDAGAPFPEIPPGKNTAVLEFKTADGLPAVAVNQKGFANRRDDNEEQVNGVSVFVAVESGSSEALLNYVRQQLDI